MASMALFSIGIMLPVYYSLSLNTTDTYKHSRRLAAWLRVDHVGKST
ncbi:MAG: hypothetical protein HOP34_08585 [Methylococcaceae bacterium]|nr:hypothetical protein [Methylococcaceae bacterium]